MGSIGFYVMTVLLCAGAVYGLSYKGEPRPAVTSGQKKLLIFLAGVVLVCLLLLLVLAFIAKWFPFSLSGSEEFRGPQTLRIFFEERCASRGKPQTFWKPEVCATSLPAARRFR